MNPKDFLSLIKTKIGKREINNLISILPQHKLNFAPKQQLKNIYFVDGVKEEKQGRASDEDIISKKTIIFDLDIRKLFPNVRDETLKTTFLTDLLARLQQSSIFSGINAVVFSGNGLHLYYIAKEEKDCTGGASLWSYNYEIKVKQLEEVLGRSGLVDIACRNIGRVFRLPGSWNDKVLTVDGDRVITTHSDNEEDWKEVEVIYWQDEKWNDAMLDSMFFDIQSSSNKEVITIDNDSWYTEEITPDMTRVDIIKRLNIKKCLERLSGTPEVKGERYNIVPRKQGGWYIEVDQGDGKFKNCNAWIDFRGRIGSGAKAGPYLWNWLLFFGRTVKQADDIIDQYFGHLLPSMKGSDFPCIGNDVSEIEKWTFSEFQTKKPYYTWGMGEMVDSQLPLLTRGQLVLLAGDAGVGKTTLATKIAVSNSKKGYKVGFYSIEMPPKNVMMREVRKRLGITKLDRIQNKYSVDVAMKSKQILQELFNLQIYWPIFTGKNPSIELINSITDAHKDLDLIIIDNLSFITSDKEMEYDSQKVIIQQLLNAAQKNNVCTILLHHFRKQSGAKDNGVRSAADLKGNNDIFNKADIVAALTRQKVQIKLEGTISNPLDSDHDIKLLNYLTVLKDREDGELTKIQLTFENGNFNATGY